MLIETIQADLKQSQLNRDELQTSTLRLLLSELKNAQINKGASLEDSEAIVVLRKELKKRSEAAETYKKAGREELAEKELAETAILARYLPAQLSTEELTRIVEEAITKVRGESLITKVGAQTMADMGKVIGVVMSQVGQQADGSQVSVLVREKLLK